MTGLTATSTTPGTVLLNWTNPTDTDFAGVRICRNFGTTAPTYPCGGVNVTKQYHSYTDTYQLTPGLQYTYSVFAFDTSANVASGPHATVTVASSNTPPPGNVTGLTATPLSSTSIKLDWTNPTDAGFAGVHICRNYGTTVATSASCPGVNVAKPATTFTDSNSLAAGTQYTYTVFAYDTAANSSSGAHVTTTTPGPGNPPPANVTNLTATPLSSSSVELDWTNPTDSDFAGVFICRNQGATAPTYPCGGVSVSGTTFTDTNVLPSTQYTYTVFAYDTAANVASGTSVGVTTPAPPPPPAPAAVTGLTATRKSLATVQLTWTDPVDANRTGIFVCRAQGSVAPTYPCSGTTLAATATSFTDSNGLLIGVRYSYTVYAFNSVGAVSPPSSVTITA